MGEKITFKISKSGILEKLEFNYKAIEEKNNLGIDSSTSVIQMVMDDTQLIFTAMNNEYDIQTVVDLGESLGVKATYIFNANNLYNSIRSFETDEINVEMLDNKMKLTQGKQLYELMYKKDFRYPEIEFGSKFEEVDVKSFERIIEKTAFCLSSDKMIPIMGCVWFGQEITLGGDGRRFSALSNNLSIKDVAIPSKILLMVYDILSGDEAKSLYYSRDMGNVYFKIDDDFYLNGHLISQNYPTKMGENILNYDNRIECRTKDFLKVVQNFSPLLNKEFNAIHMHINDKLKLSINTESCKGEDEITIINKENINGDVQLMSNYRYILDVLEQIKDQETFTMEFSDNGARCNIRTKSDEDFVHPICLLKKKEQ